MYKNYTLKNGLKIVTKEIKDRDSIAIGFWTGVGGRYEEAKIKGAAHFLEHIVFKGSAKYSCEEIKEKIEGVGGSINAFTSDEQTCFYAKIPAKHIDQTFDVLSDIVFHPNIKSADVKKESGVITEEIKMYHDLPQYYVMELLDRLMWPDHPLGDSLAGSIKTVTSMTSKDLKGFHKKYYGPQNVVLAICGNVSHEKIVRMAKRKLNKLDSAKNISYLPAQDLNGGAKVLFEKRDIEQMHLALGVRGFHENDKRRYTLNLLNVILGGNMSSRLFAQVREKRGLAYSIGTSFKAMHDTGMFLVRAGVDNQKIVPATKVILQELKKIKTDKISKDEFTRARDYLLGQLLLGLEDTMDHMLWVGESVITKDCVRTLKSIVAEFEKITPSDVNKVAQTIFKNGQFRLAVVGPLTSAQEKQLKLLV